MTTSDRAGTIEPAEAPDGLAEVLGIVPRQRTLPKQHDIILPGAVPEAVHLLLSGHTCRYRVLRDGRRQITAILVPGDICDLEAALEGRSDYAANTLTPCTVAEIPLSKIAANDDPRLAAILRRRLRRDESIAREWIVSLGRRNAMERVAHLFCELRCRLAAVGLATADACPMRITQAELADALGLTSVHVNRVMRALRDAKLIHLADGRLVLRDRPALERLAQFDPAYLQLG